MGPRVRLTGVIDVFSRRIVGWRAAPRMTTPLVLNAFEHALFTRGMTGQAFD
ncbi:hypothetical protein KEM60_01163 [Austwickia sp. TVS 96-490-7B]|nr:hypothetical protein [Austwickia sp. TVS 96-490-7B]MBW3084972.1 hypothetical protein [Austwickia sp. TVS 96-490-7B]